MKSIIIIVTVVLGLVSSRLAAQGFYIKPSFGYGRSLGKENIRYNTVQRSGEVAVYNERLNYQYVGLTENTRNKTEVLVPLANGKFFDFDFGYENKKWLYYSFGLSAGLTDNFEKVSFYDAEDRRANYESYQHSVVKQTVSSVWYGGRIEAGVYKKLNKLRFNAGISAFLGTCRIRIIEKSTTDYFVINYYNDTQHKSVIYRATNDILHGSIMSGYGINAGIEHALNERCSLGISLNYKCQYYSPTRIDYKNLNNSNSFLGSAVPFSNSSYMSSENLQPSVQAYLFESLSVGFCWKHYLTKRDKNKGEI